MTEPTDFWPWFAGFWEGDGSVGFMHRQIDSKSTRRRLDISQKDPSALEYICQTIGGRVRADKEGYHKWSISRIEQMTACVEKLLVHVKGKSRRDQLTAALVELRKAHPKQRPDHKYSIEEALFIKSMWPKHGPLCIGRKLGLSSLSVRQKALRMGLPSHPHKPKICDCGANK